MSTFHQLQIQNSKWLKFLQSRDSSSMRNSTWTEGRLTTQRPTDKMQKRAAKEIFEESKTKILLKDYLFKIATC